MLISSVQAQEDNTPAALMTSQEVNVSTPEIRENLIAELTLGAMVRNQVRVRMHKHCSNDGSRSQVHRVWKHVLAMEASECLNVYYQKTTFARLRSDVSRQSSYIERTLLYKM